MNDENNPDPSSINQTNRDNELLEEWVITYIFLGFNIYIIIL